MAKISITFHDLSIAQALNMLEIGEVPGVNDKEYLAGVAVADDIVKAAEAAPANPTRRGRRSSGSENQSTSIGTATDTSSGTISTEATPATPSRRRRGGSVSETSSLSEGESAANPTPAASDANPTPAASDANAVTSTSRRRRSTSTGVDATSIPKSDGASSAEGKSAENPTPAPAVGRRRRTETSATPASTGAPAATGNSRRRRETTNATVAAATSASPSDDKITDQDLIVAASQAATKLTPKVVLEIMAEFGVGKVNELKPEQRREFLDQLKDAMKPGN